MLKTRKMREIKKSHRDALWIQGYILATSFVNMYEHEPKGDLLFIKQCLNNITHDFCTKKINVKQEVTKAWKHFEKIGELKEINISSLTFVIQLVIKNPMAQKFRLMTDAAIRLNKEHIFSKDMEIINSKKVVNSFYFGRSLNEH